tara:strand:+ start:1889 stop:2158 length:270 start_codon:yes stop_codon:yes gene_type:complete
MKRLIWTKTEDGYSLHERSNVSWGSMSIDNNNTLTITFRDKVISKTFSSYKVANNVSHTVAERLGIKARSEVDDGNYNLPGINWNIVDG